MTARRLVTHVLVLVAVIVVMSAIAIWLKLGPAVRSAT